MILPHNPFAAQSSKPRMGLRPLSLADWIERDSQWAAELHLKAHLLATQRHQVWGSLAGSEAMQQEALNRLVAHLVHRFPDHARQEGDRLLDPSTGETWHLAAMGDRPLELASRLVQEDLCLLAPQEGQYRLVAGCVCFPSRWDLPTKLGQSLDAIHLPVPHYGETLAHPVDRFFERLRVDAPGWRLNWSLADRPDLFLPPTLPVDYRDITPQTVGDRLWLRIERQTLRRLPHTQAILFTIRTYRYPLRAIAQDPVTAGNVARAIAQLFPETQRYKSIAPIQGMLLAYLETCTPLSAKEWHEP